MADWSLKSQDWHDGFQAGAEAYQDELQHVREQLAEALAKLTQLEKDREMARELMRAQAEFQQKEN